MQEIPSTGSTQVLERQTSTGRSPFEYSYVFGTVVFYAGIWVQTWIAARLSTPAEFGRFALSVAVMQSVFAFATLNLKGIQLTDSHDEFPFSTYFRTRVWLGLAALGVGILVTVLSERSLRVAMIALALGLARMSDGLSELYQVALLRSGSPRIASRCLILRGIAASLVLVAVLWLTRSIPESVLAMAAASWCAFLFHDRRAARICGSMSRRSSIANPRRLILRSLPVGASLCFSTLAFNIPVVMIRYFQGDAALGSFYPLMHMQSAGIVIVSAMSQPISHELAASYAANALWRFFQLLSWLLLRTLSLGALICLVAIVAGHWLFGVVYGARYALATPSIAIFAAGTAVAMVGAILSCAITSTREFARLWLPYAFLPVFALAASALVIPKFMETGAALAFLFVSCATCVAPLVAGAGTPRLKAYIAQALA